MDRDAAGRVIAAAPRLARRSGASGYGSKCIVDAASARRGAAAGARLPQVAGDCWRLLAVMHPGVVFLMGPTASGKTGVAVDLVRSMKAEIVSVDSAMVYRGMDIGTAKPDAATLAVAPHHL